jgi:hypothetical protein
MAATWGGHTHAQIALRHESEKLRRVEKKIPSAKNEDSFPVVVGGRASSLSFGLRASRHEYICHQSYHAALPSGILSGERDEEKENEWLPQCRFLFFSACHCCPPRIPSVFSVCSFIFM